MLEGGAFSAIAPLEVRALGLGGGSASGAEALYADAKANGVFVSAAMVSLALHNEASGQMRLTEISIVPTSVLQDVADQSLVIIEPQGAGGGSDRLLLEGSMDDPRRAFTSFDPITGKREDDNYFRSHTFTVDSGATEALDIRIGADRVSGAFAIRIDYLYRGEEKIATTRELGSVTGPSCDSKQRLSYRKMTFIREYSIDPLVLDSTDESPAGMAKLLSGSGHYC